MEISRRNFLKVSGGAVAASTVGLELTAPREAAARALPIAGAKATNTICPYCAVGCGIVVHTKDGKILNTEGDSDHPINEGTICSKGAALYQMVNKPMRLTKPRYRKPGATAWEEVEWEWALDEIAKRIKEARDKTFVRFNAEGQQVNRTDGLAHVGSAALDNEECYLLQKWLRSLGLIYIEHQARI